MLLFSGNFKEGWKEYEWRFNAFPSIYQNRNFSIPLREGSDVSGLTVLLFSEQGFGDTIQFVRYAPLVAKRGAKVILECQKELVSLLQTVEGIHKVIVHGSELPEFDVYWPLLSSPLFFDTNLENIPQKIPYITPDNLLVEKFHNRVQNDKAKLKIGLSWAGRPTHSNDIFRSVSLDLFSPLAQIEDVTLYSLQKGEAAKQMEIKPIGWKIIDYNNEINDFSDTAGLIANLDLVISVDTAVAHLAGAIGKPVWTLIPFAPDWRWMLNREDSPWYPTMRLFRQSSPGDWESVITKVKDELIKLLANNTVIL